jgi:hypothetical protein
MIRDHVGRHRCGAEKFFTLRHRHEKRSHPIRFDSPYSLILSTVQYSTVFAASNDRLH